MSGAILNSVSAANKKRLNLSNMPPTGAAKMMINDHSLKWRNLNKEVSMSWFLSRADLLLVYVNKDKRQEQLNETEACSFMVKYYSAGSCPWVV